MDQLLTVDGVEYIEHKPGSEQELEDYIQQHSFRIFEENTIYLQVKTKLKSPSGIGSIPDAYTLNFTTSKWAIIEVELSTHPLHDHIVSQLSKFRQGIKNSQTRKQLVSTLYNAIKEDKSIETNVKQQIGSDDLHKNLTNIIDTDPSLVIIIDNKTDELKEVVDDLQYKTTVIEFKIYKRKKSGIITAFLFNTLYKPTIIQPVQPQSDNKPTMPDGLPIFFNYKRQRYDATWISHNKIMYQGKEYKSPSALSVEIAGSARNGWRDWKYNDENGTTKSIEELRK